MTDNLPDGSLFMQANRHLTAAAQHSHTAFFFAATGHVAQRDHHKQMALLAMKRAASILGLELVERHRPLVSPETIADVQRAEAEQRNPPHPGVDVVNR